MFCPTCDTLLAPSEEDDKLMEKCSMCGFKQENDKLVIKTTNYKEVVYESVEQNKYLKHVKCNCLSFFMKISILSSL